MAGVKPGGGTPPVVEGGVVEVPPVMEGGVDEEVFDAAFSSATGSSAFLASLAAAGLAASATSPNIVNGFVEGLIGEELNGLRLRTREHKGTQQEASWNLP